MREVNEWMKSGDYLPPAMRDFHDQKDLFKSIHQLIDVEEHEYVRDVGWSTGHMYVIDIFLWFMARRGYTLQKIRTKVDGLRDLDTDLKLAREARLEAMKDIFKSH